MRTDCHAHVFPPRTARHAVASLGARYGVDCAGKGTLEDLLIELRDFCLMWSENYKDHNIMTGSKEFRSWKWAKDKPTTLVPPRASQGGF